MTTERLRHHVGRLCGRCRGVVQVELTTDARQRTQHRTIVRAQLVEVAAEEPPATAEIGGYVTSDGPAER